MKLVRVDGKIRGPVEVFEHNNTKYYAKLELSEVIGKNKDDSIRQAIFIFTIYSNETRGVKQLYSKDIFVSKATKTKYDYMNYTDEDLLCKYNDKYLTVETGNGCLDVEERISFKNENCYYVIHYTLSALDPELSTVIIM